MEGERGRDKEWNLGQGKAEIKAKGVSEGVGKVRSTAFLSPLYLLCIPLEHRENRKKQAGR